MRAINGFIGIAPIVAAKTIEKKRIGGMEVPVQGKDLLQAKVLFGSATIPEGSTVYLPGDAAFQGWAKAEYSYQGTVFVKCPESAVFFVDESRP